MNTEDLPLAEVNSMQCNPMKNRDSIVIIKQEDGNYRGFMWKNGKLIQTRQGDPGTVLQLLITHD
jgi:hypothetical protein